MSLSRRIVVALVVTLVGCANPPEGEDDGGHHHHHTDGGADAGHVHEDDAGIDAGHMHEDDAGIDAGHVHEDDAGTDAGHVHEDDAGTDAGHVHEVDAGTDAGHVHVDAGTDAGHVHDAGVVDAGPPLPQIPYVAPAAPVNQSTVHVATLPRPARLPNIAPTNCPHQNASLLPWNSAWSVSDADVTIPSNSRVILRGNTDLPTATRIRTLTIPAGSELVIDDVAATYRFTDIRVFGALRFGSATCRLQSAISIEFDTPEEISDAGVRTAIAARYGLGLLVESGGLLEIFGKLYQPTWTRLATTATAGSSTVTLSEAVDWEPGQRVVVVTTTSEDYPFRDQNEQRVITEVSDGGTQVTFATPLSSNHYAGAEYQGEVGLLSRSIEFHTSAAVQAADAKFGGHVLIHDAVAHVSGLELRGMGQQNFTGRYPFHFHHARGAESYVTDSSVWQSNWRSFVVHRTNDTLVSRNVAYDVFGHSYYLEDGVELRNELSFNLAVRTKIMGPTDSASLAPLGPFDQFGQTILESPEMVQPADRAAAGFYISNGNNRIIGNAASGGFAGFTFPSLPAAIGGPSNVRPLNYGVSHFDGNSAHSAGYFWGNAGCVYVGGVLTTVQVNDQPKLQYLTGRTTDSNLLRHGEDVFNNTRTFQCVVGITHWGNKPRLVNFESYDNELMASVFGTASIQSAVVVGQTPNPVRGGWLRTGYRRGFQFYDTDLKTVVSDVVFRNFQPVSFGSYFNSNNCALLTMIHSDEFTPQNMNATQRLYFDSVGDTVRFCNTPGTTLASRNFNLYDSDGSATRFAGDGLPAGPRLVGSGYSDAWHINASCVKNTSLNMWVCPMSGEYEVAAIGTLPNQGVRSTMYSLSDGGVLGDNWYSTTAEFSYAQMTGPARIGWHHAFPNGVPSSLWLQAKQVPENSFVVYSFTLPPGRACSVSGWTNVADVAALMTSTGAAYTTDRNTCFLRIPPTPAQYFTSAGLRIQLQTWNGNPTPTTYFTVNTGCPAGAADCASVVSVVPTLP